MCDVLYVMFISTLYSKQQAQDLKIPIVSEDYVAACLAESKAVERNAYLLWSPDDKSKKKASGFASSSSTAAGSDSTLKIIVKGRCAVDPDSGLEDDFHVLEEKNQVYNATLALTDISTGANSYYILQLLESDSGNEYSLWRKWGRVGTLPLF